MLPDLTPDTDFINLLLSFTQDTRNRFTRNDLLGFLFPKYAVPFAVGLKEADYLAFGRDIGSSVACVEGPYAFTKLGCFLGMFHAFETFQQQLDWVTSPSSMWQAAKAFGSLYMPPHLIGIVANVTSSKSLDSVMMAVKDSIVKTGSSPFKTDTDIFLTTAALYFGLEISQNPSRKDRMIQALKVYTKVSSLSSAQLLQVVTGANSIVLKRQVTSIQTTDLTTQELLALCPLNSINNNATNNRDILTGCLAGIARVCSNGDSLDCRNYVDQTYGNSMYSNVGLNCKPWSFGSKSAQCTQAVADFSTVNTAGQANFAKFSQTTLFRNSSYIPCSIQFSPYKCSP